MQPVEHAYSARAPRRPAQAPTRQRKPFSGSPPPEPRPRQATKLVRRAGRIITKEGRRAPDAGRRRGERGAGRRPLRDLRGGADPEEGSSAHRRRRQAAGERRPETGHGPLQGRLRCQTRPQKVTTQSAAEARAVEFATSPEKGAPTHALRLRVLRRRRREGYRRRFLDEDADDAARTQLLTAPRRPARLEGDAARVPAPPDGREGRRVRGERFRGPGPRSSTRRRAATAAPTRRRPFP